MGFDAPDLPRKRRPTRAELETQVIDLQRHVKSLRSDIQKFASALILQRRKSRRGAARHPGDERNEMIALMGLNWTRGLGRPKPTRGRPAKIDDARVAKAAYALRIEQGLSSNWEGLRAWLKAQEQSQRRADAEWGRRIQHRMEKLHTAARKKR